MKRRNVVLVIAVVVGSAFAGCATPSSPPAQAETGLPFLAIREQLYFGRNIPAGGEVSEADWTTFLAEVVTPRFPNGLSVFRGEGQWRGKSGAIEHEKSILLEVNHADDAAGERAVLEIIAEYKRRFAQEAVLRVREHVNATLLEE